MAALDLPGGSVGRTFELGGPKTYTMRELLAWIWYPAAPEPGATPRPYAPPGWEATGAFWGFDAAGAYVRRQLWGCPRGHATADYAGGRFGLIEVLPDVE